MDGDQPISLKDFRQRSLLGDELLIGGGWLGPVFRLPSSIGCTLCRVFRNQVNCKLKSLYLPAVYMFFTVGILAFLSLQLAGRDPVQIGSQKQLFIDDHMLESTTELSRVLNRPRKHREGPVLKPERKWEGNFAAVSSVIYDSEEGYFKMWYVPSLITAKRPPGRLEEYESLLRASDYQEELDLSCYALSRDGIHWDRPNLGLVDFEGSTRNNIFSGKSVRSKGGLYNSGRAPNAFKDRREKNPDRRYKGLGYARAANGHTGLCIYFSSDGLTWREYEGNPVMVGTGDTHTVLGWDSVRKKYLAYLRPGWKDYQSAVNAYEQISTTVRAASLPSYSLDELAPPAGDLRKRTIGFSESDDFIHWTPIGPALIPDRSDPVDLQFYGMPAIRYEGFYLGFPWMLRTNELTMETQFAFSRDGREFRRLADRAPFIPLGPNGAWDDGCIYVRKPFVHNGKIWFYYLGANWRHGVEDLLLEGKNAEAAVGLATLPLDGFVSLDAGPNPGTATTPVLVFKGEQLLVNFEDSQKGSAGVDHASSLRAEILNPTGKAVKGFNIQDAEPVIHTGERQRVSWNGGVALGSLEGQPIRLRFHLRNGKFYSFEFQ